MPSLSNKLSNTGPVDAHAFLQMLRQEILDPTMINWERLLALNYASLVGHGAIMVDVGGKKGRHALVFHDRLAAKQVFIFEPNHRMIEGLARRFQGSSRATIIEKALGRVAGRSSFVIDHEHPGHSGFKARHADGAARQEAITVDVVRLDDCDVGAPDFIKIDIEGAEPHVVEGARATIGRCRPLISVEYSVPTYQLYGFGPETLYEVAEQIDYRILDLFGNAFTTKAGWLASVDTFYWDYLLMPVERLASSAPRRAVIRNQALADIDRQLRLRRLARQVPWLGRWVHRRVRRMPV